MFNVCYGIQILQKLVTVMIYHAAKHVVHVCEQRDFVLLALFTMWKEGVSNMC